MAGFFAWSLLAGRDPAAIGSVLVGHPAPRLDLPALRAGEPPLTDALLKTGKPVLVNFFASWCTPCLAEHPLLLRLGRARGRDDHRHRLEEQARGGARLAEAPRRSLQVGRHRSRRQAGLDWGLSGVPETYLIDGDGIVRLHFRGPITERDLNETILPFLKGAK